MRARHGLVAAAAILLAASVAAAAPQGPAPVVRTLPNGLRIAVFADHRMPIVQIQVLVPAGSDDEAPGETGIANLTAQMLTQGTASRSPEEYAVAVERLGGSIGGTASREFSTFNGTFLAPDFDAGLELIADAIMNPLFAESRLAEVKQQMAELLLRAGSSPATLANELLWAGVFPGHPYGHSLVGAFRTLPALAPAQIRAFHRRTYRPDRALLAIAGDVDPERAFASAAGLFGTWGGHGPERAAPPAPEAAERWRVRIVDVPQLARVELRLGVQGPGLGAPDRVAFEVAAEQFDDEWSASGLRTRRVPLQDAGLFSIATSVAVDSVGAAATRIRSALERWGSGTPSEAALAAVRHRLAGAYPLSLETRGRWIAQWMSAALAGRPDSASGSTPARVAAVRPEDAHAAVARWVTRGRKLLIAVGPAEKLRPQLEPLGDVEVVTPEAAAQATAASPSTDLTPAGEAQLARGRQLADQVIAAHGGLERLRGIKDSTLEGDIVLFDNGEEFRGVLLQVRKEPRKFLFSMTLSMMRTVEILNGRRAWIQEGQRPAVDTLDRAGTAGLESGFQSDLHHLLLAAAEPGARAAWRGRERLEEREADVLEVVTADGSRWVWFVDPETHRLLAMEQGEGGHSARRIYSDFRDAQGLLWPFGERRLLDGQPAMTLSLRRVALNTGVPETTFLPPGEELPVPKRPRPR